MSKVVRIDDDRECPTVGAVLGWEDEDRCLVAWGDEMYADEPRTVIEAMDELIALTGPRFSGFGGHR